MMSSTERSNQSGIGSSQMVIQQYARYPTALESTLQSASSLGSTRSQLETHRSPPLHRKGTPRSIQSSPRGMRSALPPSSTARSGPSMSPPLFDAMRHSPMKDTADQAESRTLPSREVTDDTIDDAYVLFILYCNPNVPSSVDTSELRKTFRCPPRSDGKSFSVFTLYELIRKLDNKELKTWIQLAIELGVEPPSMEKKQSTQKVQQYAVRLKRWMRAMHVDAFFEFCLGHPHPYYTQLPPSGPFVSESRDGVPLEEDLALRALVPQWKPKRGRKRADERELEEDKAAKRPQLDTSVAGLHPRVFPTHNIPFPQSAIPFSAYPTEDDPWMTASSSFPPPSTSDQQGNDLHWRLTERETSPAGYPQSAIIPRGTQPSEALMSAEPRSAVTPSSGEKTRARRRHGPAVSSAWPNSNGPIAGKGRGRPPNKTSTSGSFSTFQVNSSRDSSQVPQPRVAQSSPLAVNEDPSNAVSNSTFNPSATPVNQGRPGKLQLQVPQHQGAPVRLATPPTLLVNGVNGALVPQAQGPNQSQSANTLDNVRQIGGFAENEVTTSDTRISLEDIMRTLSNELLHARITGRPTPIAPQEARVLASALVLHLTNIYSQLPYSLPSTYLAFQLGIGRHFGLSGNSQNTVAITTDNASTHTTMAGKLGPSESLDATRYTVSFEYNASSRFTLQVLLANSDTGVSTRTFNPAVIAPHNSHELDQDDGLPDLGNDDDDFDHTVSDATWKQRYMRLRMQMQKKERSLSQYKRRIVEAVMADI
ncbi:putative ARS binding protein Abp2 [Penicillium brasilianum]|uniref:Putative ARS binding protein Abp2 n=1 Tax=Penicillium brasilianum TaxID=104259 RepID=A0A1S9S213_PENBI|nr:putative ARS binding protein Abp2 [Penicillium brasilianum]